MCAKSHTTDFFEGAGHRTFTSARQYGPITRRTTCRRTHRNRTSRVPTVLVGAGIIGAVAGVGSVATTSEGRDTIATIAKDIGVATGVARERAPQDGDYWRGCDDARAAAPARSIAASRGIVRG